MVWQPLLSKLTPFIFTDLLAPYQKTAAIPICTHCHSGLLRRESVRFGFDGHQYVIRDDAAVQVR